MSATPASTSAEAETSVEAPALSEKQRQILAYLSDNVDDQTYFKSRLIGEELELSAKEVGTNMAAIQDNDVGIDVEKWGYSSSTTWKVTA